ncbi:unnamed protein product, partial [Mycena citricolor]
TQPHPLYPRALPRSCPLIKFGLPHPMTSRSSFNPTETIALQSPTYSVDYSPKLGPSRDPEAPTKRWYHYVPLCCAILLITAPLPSWLYVLVNYHLQTLHRPDLVVIHVLATSTLLFMIFSALIVCVARDPGPVTFELQEDESMESLINSRDEFSGPGKWCRKCWGPKPERTHHCSICGRCVLKMDHHCPWLGGKCIGHRTYPAFLHFLLCITLIGSYMSVVCAFTAWHSISNPYAVDDVMPLHALFVALYALVFALVIGSFYFYHLYLIIINQTTIENLSPFLILRDLPPLPGTGHDLSDPPLEPELSRAQRFIVRNAHGYIHLYDIGWRNNLWQVFGWNRPYGWVIRLWCGGSAYVTRATYCRPLLASDTRMHAAPATEGVSRGIRNRKSFSDVWQRSWSRRATIGEPGIYGLI